MVNNNDEQEYLPEAQEALQKEYGLLSPAQAFSEWRQQLITTIDHLIQYDFNRLTGSLYRLDVSESKLKYLLQQSQAENAAAIITDLIIERQVEKIKSRRLYSKRDDNIPENDKW